ncbi:inward rectifier potassium channel 2-like isoform X1 [Vespula squamosa]|uniref:Inward rectifier potassium channel 2-like isoform X1 n=1 Tax=Vespula squamosa TaxID=30214 RepID=A0ABD2A583_VESSQ
MPTIERLVTRRTANEEPEEHSTTDTNTGQPNELNVSELLRPCGDGRENVGESCLEETGRNDSSREKRSLLGNFQRRAFNRISFRGESGPLLTRLERTFSLIEEPNVVQTTDLDISLVVDWLRRVALAMKRVEWRAERSEEPLGQLNSR